MKRFLNIFTLFCLIFLMSCENSTTTTTSSSVAKLSAFYFANNDSMPGLAKAVFTIEERLDTGLVWNKDSMLFGTRLDTVIPKFTFEATPGAAFLTMPDTTVVLTGYDTLDFSKGPIYLTVRSSDRTNTKLYEIRPSVHQVNPDLYEWTQLTNGIYPVDDSEQRVVELGTSFVLIASNGFELHAFSSEDGASWTDLGNPSGLPAGTKVRQIITDGTTLYYGQGNAVYTSSDAVTWTAHAVDYPVITMLMKWNGQIWALVENDGYEFAYLADNTLSLTAIRPTSDFPVSDFASVTFTSPSGRERAMIIGGFAENGKSLNARWNIEYLPYPQPEGTYRLEEFSIDRPKFTSLTGISVIWYNDQLQLFGGVDENMRYFGRDILISFNEGLTWDKADTTCNQLPEVYQARQKQTAIVRDNYIYLFGGQDKTTTYSDVYRGKLNSIDWE